MYNKRDAIMTQGLGIVSMIVLHLFCRFEPFGTPLIWITNTKPLVYYFGFFAEICAPLFALVSGYAQRLIIENDKYSYKSNWNRVLKLMVKYWIVLCVFSIIGLIIDCDGIPISANAFLLNVVLIGRYNPHWWFLNSYVLAMIIPRKVLFWLFDKFKSFGVNIMLCLGLSVASYLVERFDIVGMLSTKSVVLNLLLNQSMEFLRFLPGFFVGYVFCKFNVIQKVSEFIENKIGNKHKNLVLFVLFSIWFVVIVVLNKAVLNILSVIITFLVFNLYNKPKFVENILLVLGRNSTYMWLVHGFFYALTFRELVLKAKYSLPILLVVILLSLLTSIVLTFVEKGIYSIFKKQK